MREGFPFAFVKAEFESEFKDFQTQCHCEWQYLSSGDAGGSIPDALVSAKFQRNIVDHDQRGSFISC